MSFKTKKNKKCMTRGGSGTNKTKRHGLLSTIRTAATDGILKTASFIGDKGARFFGYKRINESEEPKSYTISNVASEASKTAATASGIAGATTGILSGVLNKANKVGEIVVDTLNKNIDDNVKPNVTDAIANTVDIAKDVVSTVNKTLDQPEFVEEVSDLTKKASETIASVVDAAEPALNDVIDKTSEIASKAAEKVGESAISVALNTAEEVPGAGVVVGTFRSLDKIATAGQAVVEAGADTVTTFADAASKVTDAIKEKIAQTSEIKNRIQSHVDKFNKTDTILKDIKNKKEEKKGGKSRKFKTLQKKLSRKLYFNRL